eukprot:6051113-Prymnesium_polylepis.1
MLLVSSALLSLASAIQPPGASFGTAYKACYNNCSDASGNTSFWKFDEEIQVFEHFCDATGDGVCIMNHFWVGANWPGLENSRLRYYVDSEAKASVDIPFGLGNGSPHVDEAQPPWSAGALFGRTGQPTGIFNTYPIPFASHVRITVELLTSVPAANRTTDRTPFWIIVRGWRSPHGVALPGSIGILPAGARLRVYENREAV